MVLQRKKAKTAVKTGNSEFDATRFKPKSLNEKCKKADARASAGATMSSFSDAVLNFIVSPTTGKTIATAGVISSLVTGGVMYSNLIYQTEGWSMGLSVEYFVGLIAATGVTIIQLLPRLHNYLPQMADQMTAKLGMTLYSKPKTLEGSPTLLDESKEWAPNSAETAFKAAFFISSVLYLVEFFGSLTVFRPIVDNKIVFSALIGIVWAVGGAEISLIIRSFMDGYCLNRRQSRIYQTEQARLRVAGEQNYANRPATSTPSVQ
jgi:hypothetical protein